MDQSRSLTFVTDLSHSTSFGMVGEKMALRWDELGYDVNLVPLRLDEEGLTVRTQKLLRSSKSSFGSPALYYGWLRPAVRALRRCAHFVNLAWESSQVPEAWPRLLADAKAVIVPSEFCVTSLKEGGVTAPVEVVPEGIDPEEYPLVERTGRTAFTGLIVATTERRKHLTESLLAWKYAFGRDPTTRLYVKIYRDGSARRMVEGVPNVVLIEDRLRREDMVRLYAEADVLIALGSEGFGLPAIEAMSTGLPVVLLDAEGQHDLCAEAGALVVPVRPAGIESVQLETLGACGYQHVPDIDDAVRALRHVRAANWSGMAEAASTWVRRHRSIDRKVAAVSEIMWESAR